MPIVPKQLLKLLSESARRGGMPESMAARMRRISTASAAVTLRPDIPARINSDSLLSTTARAGRNASESMAASS
jgi:hypothetical protein